MNARLATADLLKGIAVILMIQVHIVEVFATSAISSSWAGSILLFLGGPFVAPVFLFFLGFFAARSGSTTTQLILRGLKLFLLGMLLNLLMNLHLILAVRRGSMHVDLLPYLFGVDILHLTGLSLIILGVLRKLVFQNAWILAIAIAAVITGSVLTKKIQSDLFPEYVTAFFYGSTKWSYFPLIPWLAYVLLGLLCYRLWPNFKVQKVHPKLKVAATVLFVTFIFLTLRFVIDVSSDLPSYYHHGPVFFTWTVVFLFFYMYLVNEAQKKLGNSSLAKYLQWLGKNITLIYFLQWIVIGNIGTEIFKTMASPVQLLFSFLAIVLAVSVTGAIILRAKKNLTAKAF